MRAGGLSTAPPAPDFLRLRRATPSARQMAQGVFWPPMWNQRKWLVSAGVTRKTSSPAKNGQQEGGNVTTRLFCGCAAVSIACTPFECGHGLRARSITDARMAPRLQLTDEGGTDFHQAIAQWETSLFKNVLKLSERLIDEANKQSQWHKRMASKRLNQSGKKIEDKLLNIGEKVYFYKPPGHAEVLRGGRMTKHLGHHHGPAKVAAKVGTRQCEMEHEGKNFTRDVEMIMPQAQLPAKFQEFYPTEGPEETRKPSFCKKDAVLREGELIITRDGIENDSDDWHVAEATQVCQDRVQVNYFSTPTQNIENFKDSTELERKTRLAHQAHFRKTWFHREGKYAGEGELTVR